MRYAKVKYIAAEPVNLGRFGLLKQGNKFAATESEWDSIEDDPRFEFVEWTTHNTGVETGDEVLPEAPAKPPVENEEEEESEEDEDDDDSEEEDDESEGEEEETSDEEEEVEEVESYDELTVPDIRAELDSRGLEYTARMNKKALIKILDEDDAKAEAAGN